jgi:hypothetical protein
VAWAFNDLEVAGACPSLFEGRDFWLDSRVQDQTIEWIRIKPLSRFIFEHLVNSIGENSCTISLTLRAAFV